MLSRALCIFNQIGNHFRIVVLQTFFCGEGVGGWGKPTRSLDFFLWRGGGWGGVNQQGVQCYTLWSGEKGEQIVIFPLHF